jgi:hypothetical protein
MHTRSSSSTTWATLRGLTGSIIGHCSVVALLETGELAPWNFGHDKPCTAPEMRSPPFAERLS